MSGCCRLAAVTLLAVLFGSTSADTVEGRVVQDNSGDPLASAELKFHKPGVHELIADLETDASGRFRADIPAGEYRVEVSKPNYLTATLQLRVPAAGNAPSPPLLLRLVRFGLVTGRVTDPQGRPVPGQLHAPGGRTIGGATVSLMVKSPGATLLWPFGRSTSVDEDGRYRIFDLPPGQYAVAVSYFGLSGGAGSGVLLYPSNARPEFFNISGGEEYRNINFSILPGARCRVSGAVELPKPGVTFALALVSVEQPSLPVARKQTEPDGAFQFEDIPPGSYDLFASGPSRGYTANADVLGDNPLFGRMHVEVAGQNVEGLSIPVREGRSVAFVLRAASQEALGACLPSATLTLTSLEAWGAVLDRSSEVSFAKEQTVKSLAPGRYRVGLAGLGAACYQAATPTLDLTAAADSSPVAVEVALAGSIQGWLRAGSARPTDFVVVLLTSDPVDGAQPAQIAFPDAEARFAFTGLRPGRYRIVAQPASEASKARWVADVGRMMEIDVPGGAPTDVDLPVAAANPNR